MIGAGLSALLLAVAFPKFGLWWLAWIAVVPLFLSLRQGRAWLSGLTFALIFFSINLFWALSLFRFVGWWSVAAWIGVILLQALFFMVFVLLSRASGRGSRAIWLAVCWVAVEWLRSWGPFGLPVGVIGYSQAPFLPLVQIAAFSSVYGVSFLVVFFNAALAEYFSTHNWKMLISAVVLVLLALIYGFFSLATSHQPLATKLAIIQPDIDQLYKMNPKNVPAVYQIHDALSRQAAARRPQIIIWPETCVFTYLFQDPALMVQLKNLARTTQAWLIIGTPYYDLPTGKIFNSIVALSPQGEVGSRYDKEHLVPFGEYLPFKPLLLPLLKRTGYFDDDFNQGKYLAPLLVGSSRIAPAICFESLLPGLIKNRVGKSTDFILVVTNDAWFDDSSAPYFHLNAGVFRAIENRKWFIQAGNTGLSAVIDPYGRIIKKSQLNERQIIYSY